MKVLIAKRKNPELNPKISILEELRKYKNEPDYYVTFTNTNLLKVNPKASYKNPAGIYCYNIRDAFKNYPLESKGVEHLYAGSGKYAIIFTPKPGLNIVDLDTFDKKDYDFYNKKLKENVKMTFARRRLGKKKSPDETWAQFFLTTVGYYNVDLSSYIGVTLFGGKILHSNTNFKWASFFKKIGIHGLKDTTGNIQYGIPAMAVFFRTSYVNQVKTIQIKDFNETDDETNERSNKKRYV